MTTYIHFVVAAEEGCTREQFVALHEKIKADTKKRGLTYAGTFRTTEPPPRKFSATAMQAALLKNVNLFD